MNKLLDGFFTGINYWGSENAIQMWENFDAKSIEKDFQLLKGTGITHLRVFPLWPVFQPLHALYGPDSEFEYAFGEEPLPDTLAGRAGVSEEACRNFEIFCGLAQKYEMHLIVALITGHMSFRTYNPPAFNGKDLLSDPVVIKWQLRFVKYFVRRFKDTKAIIGWDLGNETTQLPGLNGNKNTFYVWSSMIADAIKVCDPSRPVISGLDFAWVENGYANLKDMGEMCDMHTVHPYNVFSTPSDPLSTMKPLLDLPFMCRLGEDIAKIPTFVQEFGAIGYMNCSKKTEADFYRAALWTCFAHGFHGVMWWCAFDQGHHTYAPYRWNTIGSDYGFFDKDLCEKPIVEENRRFKKVLEALPDGELPKHTINGTILIPREESESFTLLRTTYILAKQANLDMQFSYILDPIPDSPLYILPSIKTNKAIEKRRLNELLAKVEQGAVLYMCADTGLIRQIPEITGVEMAYREKVDAEKMCVLNGESLPIHATYFYKPERANAEIIATDENGEGVFFKHKYGKGFVYFLTLPLESYVSQKNGVFFKENQPSFHKIYRELAQAAKVERICDSDNPFVRLTEHPIDDKSLYAVAINYHNQRQTAAISVAEGYTISSVFGSEIENGKLSLRENDGAIFKLERK